MSEHLNLLLSSWKSRYFPPSSFQMSEVNTACKRNVFSPLVLTISFIWPLTRSPGHRSRLECKSNGELRSFNVRLIFLFTVWLTHKQDPDIPEVLALCTDSLPTQRLPLCSKQQKSIAADKDLNRFRLWYCRFDTVFRLVNTLANPNPTYRSSDPRNVCTSETPVCREEILPSNLKKKAQYLFTLCHRAIDIIEKQEREGTLHFVAVILNKGALFPLLKVYSLIFLEANISYYVNSAEFLKSYQQWVLGSTIGHYNTTMENTFIYLNNSIVHGVWFL